MVRLRLNESISMQESQAREISPYTSSWLIKLKLIWFCSSHQVRGPELNHAHVWTCVYHKCNNDNDSDSDIVVILLSKLARATRSSTKFLLSYLPKPNSKEISYVVISIWVQYFIHSWFDCDPSDSHCYYCCWDSHILRLPWIFGIVSLVIF